MLNKIIGFSLQNRILVLAASANCAVADWRRHLYRHAYGSGCVPDLNAPTVVIMTEANGMAAEEVEQLVTFPVETAVNGATGAPCIFLNERFSLVVWVEFDWDARYLSCPADCQ